VDKIKTGGGTFERTQTPIYFISSYVSELQKAGWLHGEVLVALNNLNVERLQTVDDWLTRGKRVFLDSGVFMLGMNHGRKHGLSFYQVLQLQPDQIDGYDKLWSFYREVVGRFGDRLWGYVEVDQGGTQAKIDNRSKMEAEGLFPIPVYHPFVDEPDYLPYLMQRYDRICLANVVQTPREERKRLLATVWKAAYDYPDVWIHVLGYTPDTLLNAYPMHSADCSTFLSGVRWGSSSDRAMNSRLGELPANFNYKLGEVHQPEGRETSYLMAGYCAMMQQRSWRHMVRAQGDLGFAHYTRGEIVV
jgi:hypothetical protein